MSAIAIITARGGSKRIPRKNIKEFCGKPIINYSIEAALASGIFDEVMVSTDDEEIAEIAKKAGAKVPFFRSAETSNDTATTADVLLEVLDEYEKRGQSFEYGCCIYPTAPFVTARKLKEAMDELVKSGAESIVPMQEFSYPPQRGLFIDDKGLVKMLHPEYATTRSQDLQKQYHECGQFYIFRNDAFRIQKDTTMEKSIPYIIDPVESQDIDNESDWLLAELKYRFLTEQGILK
ncbi:N-acylneuraminate cytidylyltransferase [Butyrivibrio sp. ob235]|uniref:pseudaminic acid cytidylyltransferase n=1 Tax=unclassified Butyrivibrio TaxID=2639466 RepID=UPI0003B64832|nr:MULTISPECIES: pseudaminic acid cytidylyltransferase [unclassified Butyrivibrio]SEK82844.1 N-acylneuraminate cytidylyltransferase [Butyrivibrio sp. ob235]